MIAALMAAVVAGQALAYGVPISLADAKKVLAAAQAEAVKRNSSASLAIVDPYGELVLAVAAENADGGAVDVAMLQARASVDYRGKLTLSQQSSTGISYTDATPAVGGAGAASMGAGALLISNGKIIGAIGDAGASAERVAQAGATAAASLPPGTLSNPPPRASGGMGMATPGMGAPAPGMAPPASAAASPASAPPAGPSNIGYGMPITVKEAEAVGVLALAEKVAVGTDEAAVAVVDPAGRLLYFARQDSATFGNLEMAVLKARASARLRRATSGDNTRLKNGEQILLLVPSAFPADGGEPLVRNRRVVGAVGLAGGGRDGPVAQTAAKVVN